MGISIEKICRLTIRATMTTKLPWSNNLAKIWLVVFFLINLDPILFARRLNFDKMHYRYSLGNSTCIRGFIPDFLCSIRCHSTNNGTRRNRQNRWKIAHVAVILKKVVLYPTFNVRFALYHIINTTLIFSKLLPDSNTDHNIWLSSIFYYCVQSRKIPIFVK